MIFVIEDDASMREALIALFESVGLRAKAFGSVLEFLGGKMADCPSCLVLDVRLPGMSGLDLQAHFAEADIRMPIVFITGHGDIPMTVKAIKAGAVEFLTKPFRDQDLLDAVQQGLEMDRVRRRQLRSVADLRSRFESLTPREQQVITLVSTGLMNKQIAGELGVTEITVKVHRANAMRKMGAKSLASVIRMVQDLGPHGAG
ncbi:MAG TPA: response regulator transcription factor [Hyphomicrobiaceae bacterium]|nr:response regulator transcription factor [Hyphomicrobiaceae bacterium]